MSPGESAAFTDRYAGREPFINEALYSRPRVARGADALTLANATTVVSAETGETRIVATLGGRRIAAKDEIAAINARLKAFEEAQGLARPAPPAPAGVTPMAVVEVGRAPGKTPPAEAAPAPE